MRRRGQALDVLLVAAAIGFDVMTTWHTWGTSSAPAVVCAGFSVLAGVPMGFVRQWPVPVAGYLSGLLILTDQISAFTVNTVQILLLACLGVVAYKARPLAVLCSAALGAVATGFNLADPGLAFTASSWWYSAGAAVVPVLIGAYLRGPAGRLTERDITPDVLLAGGGVALTVLNTWTEWDASGLPVWVVGSLVVLAGLSLGVARRLPGLVFVLQVALMLLADQYFQAATATCVMLVLIAAGVFAMRVASWLWTLVVYLVAVLTVALFTVAIGIVGPGAEVEPMRVVVLMTLVVAPVAIGRYLRVRQAAGEAERLRVRESQRLALAQMRADQLAERESIAREVHDIVAHHVGAMALRAGAARYADPDGPSAQALTDIRDTGHQVLEDLRGLLDLLRDPGQRPDLPADPADPADVVRESAERMAAAGLLVELDVGPEVEQVPLVARASATRIIQEGLTNVLKHAGPGTKVRVSLTSAPDGLAVEVRNGPPPTAWRSLPSSGQGLRGMRERARALGGTLSAGPDEDGGWLLTVLLPTRETA
ncbi:histidine kinase [Nonomuraea sp. 3-1Str]|uniref:sensor histidine kinase n=1 Tax=Nonomuraea sp. 3-1Str TaxID=2929801 RepID=UPI0028562A00|nr:histidine kinase [Nonomuraea sp. 3-1Str]MDR8409840.1 histidine kinase [Nonomuraea sp. 3-1Str]